MSDGLASLALRMCRSRSRSSFRWFLGSTPARFKGQVGLYTMLLLPILYGVWHTKGGWGGGAYCPIVVQ